MRNIAKMAMMQQANRNEGSRNEGNQGARNEGNYRAEGRSENRMENRMEGRADYRMGQGEYYPPRDGEDTEMRRRRDSRGRFMEGGDGAQMRDDYDFEFRRRRAGMDEESPEMRRANMYALPRGERIGFMSGNEMHYGERQPQDQRMGYSQGSKSFDHETAQEWVRKMKNTDGTTGQHWSMEQAKNLMTQVGVTGIQPVEFWAILNALRSDYFKVAKKFGVDRPEFYAELTKAWLDDADAVDNKAMMYYEYIVK